MRFGSLHMIDILVVLAYLAAVIWIGRRTAAGTNSEEGFSLAGGA
jgi:Na+/proline symporter